MLVLSRQENEIIDIGKDISIQVVMIGPNSVRIGINAPREIPVHRREVTEAIAAEEQRKRE